MLPVLLDLKIVRIYTVGAFLVLAFFWGSFLLWRNIRLSSYKEEDIFDGVFTSLFGGLLLARIVHVALHFSDFGFDIFKFILINGYPGLSLYGFLVGGYTTLALYFRRRKIKFRDTTNYFVPPTLLALSIGTLGIFFSRIYYPALMAAILYAIAAYISNRIFFAYRRQKYPQTFNLAFFCWSFSLIQVAVGALAKSQIVFPSILLLTFSFYFLYHFRSLVLKKISLHKNSLFKKHVTHKKHHPESQEKTGE